MAKLFQNGKLETIATQEWVHAYAGGGTSGGDGTDTPTNITSTTLTVGGSGFDITVDLTTETLSSLAKADTALQSFTETDPVYTADKPTLALKTDLPNPADFATSAQGAKADTALQKETDPVYTADKPSLALKSEIPNISGLATKSELSAVDAKILSAQDIITLIETEMEKRLAVRTQSQYGTEQNIPIGRLTAILPD